MDRRSSMFCTACGTELPDSAKFCMNCGRPLSTETAPNTDPPRYEVCRIDYRTVSKGLGQIITFYAQAVGPNGAYDVAKMGGVDCGWYPERYIREPFGPRGKALERAVWQLSRLLTRRGWEPVGRGETWYSHEFRRKVT